MVDQDPCSGSVAGHSGHGMMEVASEVKPVNSDKELIRAMSGIDEEVSGRID